MALRFPAQACTFPGLDPESIIRASYSCGHSITPGVIQVECEPRDNLPTQTIGNLALLFGTNSLTLTQCRIDLQQIRRNSQGLIWSFSILDRRWKWRFGTVDGRYNYRLSTGAIDTAGQKNARELADILFFFMGEVGDSSRIPTDSYPPVEWYAANPAQELCRLAEMFAMRVVFSPISDSTAIWPEGTGGDLPLNNETTEIQQTIDPPEAPDVIRVACGPTKFDATFDLEAVGLDSDDQIKPIDDLSYKPTGGWAGETVGVFAGVASGFKRDLAKATVLRWYRIKDSAPLAIPGYVGSVTKREQILPIDDHRIEEVVTDGAERRTPAEVKGTFSQGRLDYKNSDPDTNYERDFSIDGPRGVVEFRQYVFKWSADDATRKMTACTDLKLTTACSVYTSEDNQHDYYYVERTNPSGQTGAGTQVILHSELFQRFVDGAPVKQSELDTELNAYLDDAANAYQTKLPRSASYGGLQLIPLDGAVNSVEWVIGGPFCTTKADRNNEHGLSQTTQLTYSEKRRSEQLRKESLEDLAKTVNEGRGVTR